MGQRFLASYVRVIVVHFVAACCCCCCCCCCTVLSTFLIYVALLLLLPLPIPSFPFPSPPPLIPWQVDHIKTLTTGRVMFAFTKIGTVGLCLRGPLSILIGCLLTTGTVMFAFTHLPIYQNRYLRRGPAGRDVYSLLPRPAFGDRPDQGDYKQPINIYNGPIKHKPTCYRRPTRPR